MKGVIINCLKELVVEKFGKEKWDSITLLANVPAGTAFLNSTDLADTTAMKIIESTCQVLNISRTQAADAFGDYWANTFAPKMYGIYYNNIKTAKEMIMKLNFIHDMVTKSIRNATPPQFEITEKNANTLVVKYISKRGMLDFYIGLVKGVGRYFKQKLVVKQISGDTVEIIFQ